MTRRTWDDRADRFEDRPLWESFKWILGACLVVLAVMVILTPLGWGFGWFKGTAEVTGFDNTRQQATALRDDYTSLQATAGNVCDVQRAGDTTSANDPQIIGGTAGFQYRANYRRIKADYDRRMSNAFEAGWVRKYPVLSDLPRQAPSLAQMKHKVC